MAKPSKKALRTYAIDWRIEGRMIVWASSVKDAQAIFDGRWYSALNMVQSGEVSNDKPYPTDE